MRLAREYMPGFASEFHWRPDETYEMPWVDVVTLSLLVDDVLAERKRQADSC